MSEFFIVTEDRQWGSGKTIYEAAKNAGISDLPIFGSVFYASDLVKPNTMFCNELGDMEWVWSDPVEKIFDKIEKSEREFLCSYLISSVRVAQGHLTLVNGDFAIAMNYQMENRMVN
jgi:hypothetical protein